MFSLYAIDGFAQSFETWDRDTIGASNMVLTSDGEMILSYADQLRKFDSLNNFLWSITLPTTVKQIDVDPHGNIYTVGDFNDTLDFDPGSGVHHLNGTPTYGSSLLDDIYIVKYSANGDFVWAKMLEVDQSPKYLTVQDIKVTIDKVTVMGGFAGNIDFDPDQGVETFSNTNSFRTDGFILQLDSSGSFLKSVQLWNSYLDQNTELKSLAQGGDGRLLCTGNSSEGTLNYATTSTGFSIDSLPNAVPFVIRFSPNLGYVFLKQFTGWHTNWAMVGAFDSQNAILLGGGFHGTADFDPGLGIENHTALTSNLGHTNAYILKLSNTGVFQWCNTFGSNWNLTECKSIVTDNQNNVYLGGRVYEDKCIDFDNSSTDYYAFSNNRYNTQAFIQKITSIGYHKWTRVFGGTGGNSIVDLGVTSSNRIFGFANTRNNFDIDFGPYVQMSNGGNDGARFKLEEGLSIFDTVTVTDYCGYFAGNGCDFLDSSGVYSDQRVSINGIDSFITLNLTILDTSYQALDTLNLATGDSAYLAGAWQTTAGTYVDSLQSESGCDSIVTTTLQFSSQNALVCTGNPNLDEWAFVIGGVADESVIDAASDDCGNLYVVGYTVDYLLTSSTIDFDPNGTNNQQFSYPDKKYFMVKYTTEGALEWVYKIPYVPSSIDVSADGRIAVTGKAAASADFDLKSGIYQLGSNGGVFVAQYDAEADLLWAFEILANGNLLSGDISLGPNNQVAVTIQNSNATQIDFNPDTTVSDSFADYPCSACGFNPRKKFLVVFDSNGNWEWRYTQGAMSACGSFDVGYCEFDQNGNVFYANAGCGNTGSVGAGDVFNLYKFNAQGAQMWRRSMDGPGVNMTDYAIGLNCDENGNIYVMAQYHNSIEVDSANQFSLGNDFGAGAPFCFTNASESICGWRSMLAKYESDGTYDWAFKIGDYYNNLWPSHHARPTDIDVRNGQVVVVGQMKRQLDFDPDPLDTVVINNYDTTLWDISNSTFDAFVVTYDYSGDYVGHYLLGGPGNEGNLHVTIDDFGNNLIVGEFSDSVDFDIDSASYAFEPSAGQHDIFIFKNDSTIGYEQDSVFVVGPDTCWDAGQKVVNSDRGIGDYFGSKLAIDNDWAAIGSSDALPNNGGASGGAVYTFHKSNGAWSESQKIVPNYRSGGEQFGNAITMSGEHLLVANAPFSSSDTFKLYYYKRNSSNQWTQEQLITSGLTNKPITDLAINGQYAFAGVASQGKVLVFQLLGNNWTLDTTIQGSSGDRFGISVDAAGSMLAVGAYWDDLDANGQNNVNKAGAIYLYESNGNGGWSLDEKVVSPQRESNGYFGWDLALMDDELFAGTYTHDTVINSQTLAQSGIVYRYQNNGGWAYEQSIAPDELFSGGLFGYTLAGRDGKLLVGHRRYSGTYNSSTLNFEGAAHLFEVDSNDHFVQSETFLSTNRNTGDEFGVAVGVSGNSALIGSFLDFTDENNQNSINQAGAAHFFNAECDPILVSIDSAADTICSGDSVYLEGAWQYISGTYIDTVAIDTIRYTTLMVLSAVSIEDTVSICNGDSVFVHGNYVQSAGTYYDTVGNGTCDSVSIITVLEGTASYHFVLEWIYQGDSIYLGGGWQTEANIYTDIYTSATGCDSLVETFLWVYPLQTATDSVTICAGDTIWLGGAPQTSAGTYVDTIWSAGTAVVTTTTLFVNNPISIQTSQSITVGDSVYIGGQWRTTSGTYCDTIGGCDTIHCISLNVGSYIMLFDSVAICMGDSHYAGGQYQHGSGTFVDTISNGGSNDTILITQLYVDPNNFATVIYSSGFWLKTIQTAGPFQWLDCDLNTIIATTGSPYYQPGYAGNFALIYSNNCGDTSACVSHANTANKRGGLDVRGYPSTVRDGYTVEFDHPVRNIHMELYDLQGQLITAWERDNMSNIQLNLRDYAAGCYLLSIQTDEGPATLKFIKVVD